MIGQAFESAESTLQGAGFEVAREDVESQEDPGIVVGQDPAAGAEQSRGSTVTLQVSQGPGTEPVPDVTSQDEGQARAALEDAGFVVDAQDQETEDPTLDGKVLVQEPEGGTELEQGETVTIFVGRFVAPDEPPPPPTTTTTTTPP